MPKIYTDLRWHEAWLCSSSCVVWYNLTFIHKHTDVIANDYRAVCFQKAKYLPPVKLLFRFADKATPPPAPPIPLYSCTAFPKTCGGETCWFSAEVQRLTECVTLWDQTRDIYWSAASSLGTRCVGDRGQPRLIPQVPNSFRVYFGQLI